MDTILLAEAVGDLRDYLKAELSRKYRVIECKDGKEALEKLRKEKFDAAVVSMLLPVKDGLTVLREAGEWRPPVIVCTTTYIPHYIEETARELNIGYIVRLPCNAYAIVSELENLMSQGKQSVPYEMVMFLEKILCVIGFLPKTRVYKRLLVCIPRFAQDMEQSLTKELYVDTAKICGAANWKTVESSLRRGIKEARTRSDTDLWAQYFGSADASPTCEAFLRKLAQILKNEYPYL